MRHDLGKAFCAVMVWNELRARRVWDYDFGHEAQLIARNPLIDFPFSQS
jgi:hypothetical protein